MPHVYKDVPVSQLHQLSLLDRSPVQTPAHTAAHTPSSTPSQRSPITSRCSTPEPPPMDRSPAVEFMSIPPLSLLMSDHGFADTPFVRIPNKATTTLKAGVHRAPDFKGTAAHGVGHLDRSPVQTAYNTRSHSPVTRIRTNESYESVKSADSFSDHDEQQAGEVVKALNERVVQLGLSDGMTTSSSFISSQREKTSADPRLLALTEEKTPTKNKKSN